LAALRCYVLPVFPYGDAWTAEPRSTYYRTDSGVAIGLLGRII